MKINIIDSNENTRVCLMGELDTTATVKYGDELRQVVLMADKTLVIDCSQLEYISSAGLRFFMQLKRASDMRGGRVLVTHLNESVAEIFRISGFHHILDIE